MMGEEPRDIYREALDANDPTKARAVMHFPKYVFREGLEPVAYQVFKHDESSEVIHERCAKTTWDREFPLYADDIEAMRCMEPIVCDACEGQIAEAKEIF
jgi:hypothetical protein